MTLEEARSHIGQSVLYSAVGAEAEDAVIAHVTGPTYSCAAAVTIALRRLGPGT
jgi:hypothetical protein